MINQRADLTTLRQFAGHESAALEKAMREDLFEALDGKDPLLAEVIEYALFGGGKRIRPLLATLSARVCGRSDLAVYRLAAAFEYLHVATLIHDDVIDHARERRGRPSVVNQYGLASAILAGDWLHARSMYLVGRFGGQDELEVFCRSTTGMVDGEFLQLRYVADCDVTEQQYYDVIHRKTALLIESTCEIGAIFGGSNMAERSALATYGHKLGIAFQVVDDLLDYLGDTASTGKKTGNDFIEGKITLPLIHAMERGGNQTRVAITTLFENGREDSQAFKKVYDIIEKNNGFTSARQSAETLVGEAIAALEVFSDCDDQESLNMLRSLAAYVIERNR